MGKMRVVGISDLIAFGNQDMEEELSKFSKPEIMKKMEDYVKGLSKREIHRIILKYTALTGVIVLTTSNKIYANPVIKKTVDGVAMTPAETIREGFKELLEVATAVAEPVLWFYAITACVLMATGSNRDTGWKRLKNVGYSYIGITMLPSFFVFLRWIAKLFESALTFAQ